MNGDGKDDLLVGAPFTEHRTGGGSVFLYINRESSLNSDYYIEIRGTFHESQFGLSLTGLGDINKDGFDDFAVGSPYEDVGAVYIFLGSSLGISGYRLGRGMVNAVDVASQIIKARDFIKSGNIPVPTNFSTFGSSLSGGTDLDNNNYPGKFKTIRSCINGLYNILDFSQPVQSCTNNPYITWLYPPSFYFYSVLTIHTQTHAQVGKLYYDTDRISDFILKSDYIAQHYLKQRFSQRVHLHITI